MLSKTISFAKNSLINIHIFVLREKVFRLVLYWIKVDAEKKIGWEKRNKKLELQENMKKKLLKTDREEEIVGHDLFL